jgi:hypothetical protein
LTAPVVASRTFSSLSYTERKARWKASLFVLLCLCILRLWLMPLPSSLWVDELGTVFVVHHGAADPSLRAVPQVPASIYYALPRFFERLFGFSEAVYRLPSVLAMIAALYLIGRIASRLVHKDAGWFAAFACLALRGFNDQAADARPYALGALVGAAAIWFLIRWLDRGLWRDAAWFGVSAALLWRVHLIFWPFYLVFAVYAAVRIGRLETAVSWLKALPVFGAIGVSLIPVALSALAIYRTSAAHVIAPLPSVGELFNSLKFGLISATCSGAAILSRWKRWPYLRGTFTAGDITLIVAWWLVQPLGLFAFSWITGASVFVGRYLYVALPGVALAAAAGVAAFLRPAHWRTASAVLGGGVLLLMGGWNHLWPAHHHSDWRAAAQHLNQVSSGSAMPVLCPSPFIEAKPPVWTPNYSPDGFLYSNLAVYRVQGKIVPFPFEVSPQAARFAASLAQGPLPAAGRFAIYGGDREVLFWRNWFAARPELAGWQDHRLGPFGDVEIVVFERGK